MLLALVLSVTFLLILAALLNEAVVLGYLFAIVSFLVVTFVLDVDTLGALQANPALTVGLFLGYYAVGGIYSVFRWWLRVDKIISENKSRLSNPNEANFVLRYKIQPSHNFELLFGWVSFWPVDLVLFTIEEPARRTIRWLISTYVRITNRALAKHGLDIFNDHD